MFFLVLIFLLSLFLIKNSFKNDKIAIVAVFGDIGRSPRMQFHSISLLENGFKVHLITFKETNPMKILIENKDLKIHYLHQYRNNSNASGFKYIIIGILKVLSLVSQLMVVFCRIPKSRICLVQTPPAIPTLAIFQIYCLVMSTKLIIDWHNFGYSIMALSKGKFIVKIAEMYNLNNVDTK
jgi:beta-1,4-mannosyltransferase